MDMHLEAGFRREHDHAVPQLRQLFSGSRLLVAGVNEGIDAKTIRRAGLKIIADHKPAEKNLRERG